MARRVLMPPVMNTEHAASYAGTPTQEFAVHMHLVFAIVADFMRRVPRSVQREDLVAAGSVGLLHALRSDKHTSVEMFVAYARIRIRGAIIDELRRHDWSPRRRRSASAAQPSAGAGREGGEEAGAPAPVVVIGFDDLPPTCSLSDEALSPYEQVEAKHSSAALRSAIERLPPRERAILLMRFFEEVPNKTIASSMGLSEARISQLLARATAQLKQHLLAGEVKLAVAA